MVCWGDFVGFQPGWRKCLPIRVDLCEYDLSAVVSMIAPPFDYYLFVGLIYHFYKAHFVQIKQPLILVKQYFLGQFLILTPILMTMGE